MLGIIIGIGSVIAILTVGDSLSLSVSENMQAMGANDIYVMLKEKEVEEDEGSIDGIKYGTFQQSSAISEEDYITSEMINEMCEKFPDEIYAINLEHSVGIATVEIGKNSSDINVSGVSAGYFVTNDLEILAGTMFSQIDFEEGKKAILVSDSFVEDVFDGDNKKAIRN